MRATRFAAGLAALVLAAGWAPGPRRLPTTPSRRRTRHPGPYGTTTATVAAGAYVVYRPADYAALGFDSPIVTWGNGTDATPDMYSTLLGHLASYGFTVIASTLTDTGSGTEIDAGARYLVAQNGTAGSIFAGHLDTGHVAAVGHSQGAGGATRAAINDPALVTTLMTFSLPNTIWVGANPDCPTAADCDYDTSRLTQPTFFVGTHGLLDLVIASPGTEKAFYASVPGHASLGLIATSDGTRADHNSIQDSGNPAGFLGYATAWLEYRLRGDPFAAGAFTGTELVGNANWPGSATK